MHHSMNTEDYITDEGMVDAPSAIPDLPNDGFIPQKHHSLSRIGKEILALEHKGNEAYDDHKKLWNTAYKPMLELQIEEMENRSFDLYQRLDSESKIGMEHSLMLNEEFQACKEALDDVNRRIYCPDANYVFGGSDMGGVFVSFDDFHIEYANGHLHLKLTPGETPSITLEMMSGGSGGGGSGSGTEGVSGSTSSTSLSTPGKSGGGSGPGSSSGTSPSATQHEHGVSVRLRLDNFRLRSTKEAGLPNITFAKLEVQLSLNISIVLKFVTPKKSSKHKHRHGHKSKSKWRGGSFSSNLAGASSGFRSSFMSDNSNSSSGAGKSSNKNDDQGRWTTTAADFKIDLLSFKGPYGIPRSLVSLILTFAAPLIREAVVSNLPDEFGYFLQSLTSPFTSSGDFSLVGVSFPIFATKLNSKENNMVMPTVLGCSSAQIDEFYLMQKRVYGGSVPLQKLDDIVTYK